MKRIRDIVVFVFCWLWLRPAERAVIRQEILWRRRRIWIVDYLAPAWLVG